MISNHEFVSRVINDIVALNKDSHVSRRWILSIARTKAESYIVQKWDDGSMLLDYNIITKVGCIKMIEVNKIDCCDNQFALCGTLMRSEKRLPGLAYSAFGPTIVSVSNVDDTLFFKYSDIRSIDLHRKRKYSSKARKLYYVIDGYIYIPDEHIELINISFFTMKRREALRLSSCKEDDGCKSEWEYDFICPIKLIEYISSETIKEVAMKLQIPIDENPNMDSNQKSQIVQ